MKRWNGFYNKTTFYLFNMIFGVGYTVHLERIRGLSDEEMKDFLRDMFYGALYSPYGQGKNNYANALQTWQTNAGSFESPNYNELVPKIREKIGRLVLQGKLEPQ